MGLSGDYNPLYADVEHARRGYFGEPVVPGALIAAIAGGLGAMDVPGPAAVGLVGMSWRFSHPVRIGDTLRCRWRLNRKRDVEEPRWGLAVWQVEVENQHGQVVAAGEYLRLVERRDVEAASRRRRRSRGEPHLASKPAPGPLWLLPSPSLAEEPSAPRPERRRRRRRLESPAEEPVAPAEVMAVESTPAPPSLPEHPATRRRRRRAQPVAEAAAEPQPVAAGAVEAKSAAEGERQEPRSRRRRRRSAPEPPVAEAIQSEPWPEAEPAGGGGWQPPEAVRQRLQTGDPYSESKPAPEPELAPVSGTD